MKTACLGFLALLCACSAPLKIGKRNKDYVFRATGNEPGWVLMADGKKFRWVTNYGIDTFNLRLTDKNLIRKRNLDTVVHEAESISFAIRKTLCHSDMNENDSGTHAVAVYYNDQVYRGCGKWVKK